MGLDQSAQARVTPPPPLTPAALKQRDNSSTGAGTGVSDCVLSVKVVFLLAGGSDFLCGSQELVKTAAAFNLPVTCHRD